MDTFSTSIRNTDICFVCHCCSNFNSALHFGVADHSVAQEGVKLQSSVWVVKLKPFFDAYTGPYKDKYHFWTGFLLLVRIILFLAIAANVTKGPILNLTLVCVTAATLFLFSHPGVYKSWLLSLIESFTYFNLILFSIGTAYVLQQNSHKPNSQQDYQKEKTVLVCVGSMFLLFCGIVTWNIYQCLGGALLLGEAEGLAAGEELAMEKEKVCQTTATVELCH